MEVSGYGMVCMCVYVCVCVCVFLCAGKGMQENDIYAFVDWSIDCSTKLIVSV